MFGRLRAIARGTPTLLGGAHDDLRTGHCARTVAILVPVAFCHREIARSSSAIAREPGQIAGIGGRVSFVAGLQARCRRDLALLGAPAPAVAARFVLTGIDAVREVAIAGGLIAIGRNLVAVGAGLVPLIAGLVGVGERLLAIRKRLLAVGEALFVTSPA